MKELSAALLSIIIAKHRTKVIDPGFFKSKYVIYVISTPSKGYLVERRYKDFLAVRQSMANMYPGYIISPLPTKKTSESSDSAAIQKRKAGLELFLRDVLDHPVLRHTSLINCFLSMPPKDWENKLESFTKVYISREVEKYATVEGEAKILFTESTRDISNKISSSSRDIREGYNNLKKINKVIISDIERVQTSMNKASLIYKKLSTTFDTLGQKNHSELFTFMSETYLRMIDAYKEMNSELSNNFGSYFKFYADEISAFEEVLNAKKTTGEHMESAEKKLLRKKEQKFELKDTANWELDPSLFSNVDALLNDRLLAIREMLPSESYEARKTRIWYGYYTNKVVEELERLTKKNQKKLILHFSKAAESLAEKQDKMKAVWMSIIEKMKQFETL